MKFNLQIIKTKKLQLGFLSMTLQMKPVKKN